MPSQEATNPIAIGPGKYNLAIMEVFKGLKEDMDKSLSEDHEHRICESERMKTIKDIKVEFNKECINIFLIKSLKKISLT